jgi:hypothetical protein
MGYLQLSENDVNDVMIQLLDKNEKTTSMEVKEELRNRGYWATQAIIGPTMQKIADVNGIVFDFNGTYRTYYKPGTQMSPTPAPTAHAAPVQTPPKVRPPKPSDQDRQPLQTASTGDWIVTNPKVGDTLIFAAKLTAGQAKYAFKKQKLWSEYTDIRANRSK